MRRLRETALAAIVAAASAGLAFGQTPGLGGPQSPQAMPRSACSVWLNVNAAVGMATRGGAANRPAAPGAGMNPG